MGVCDNAHRGIVISDMFPNYKSFILDQVLFQRSFFKKKNCKPFLNVFYLLQSVKYNPLMAKFLAGYLLISSRSVAIFAVQQIDKNASI
jgi:hypothetical protein